MTKITSNIEAKTEPHEDEIDFQGVWQTFTRKRLLIAGITLFGTIMNISKALNSKHIWEGQFEIVVELDKKRSMSMDTSSAFLALAGLSSGGGKVKGAINTEMAILQSPSVLRPVFDYYKSKLETAGNDVSKLNYDSWRNSKLKVDLLEGTSILNVKYQDTDKDSVLPMSRMISESYQSYSGRDRIRSIEKAIKFTKNQLTIFSEKSKDSNRKLDNYSLKYGIPIGTASVGRKLGNIGALSGGLLDRNTGAIAEGFNNLGLNVDTSLASKGTSDPYMQLAGINQELIRRKKLFTDKDPSVLYLLKEREAVQDYISTTAGGNITLPGKEKLASAEAQNILIKFRELEREAQRNSQTLSSLENNYHKLELERARQKDPWELISEPRLLDIPVGPNKRLMVIIGFGTSLVLGALSSLILERSTGKVYSYKDAKALIPYPILTELPIKGINESGNIIDLLIKKIVDSSEAESIGLVLIGNIDENILEGLRTKFLNGIKGKKLIVSNNVMETKECENQILITTLGVVKRAEITKFREELALQGSPVTGCLLLARTI